VKAISIAKGKAGGDEVKGVVVMVVVCASNLLVHSSNSKVSCWARCKGSNSREKKVDRKGGYSKHD
jgi:hypothetical protein